MLLCVNVKLIKLNRQYFQLKRLVIKLVIKPFMELVINQFKIMLLQLIIIKVMNQYLNLLHNHLFH